MPRRPNLLLIMTDQQRADAAGFANPACVDTPHLDALAARGVVFTNAYSASTTCVPARSALLTGLFDHRLPRGPDGKALRDGYWNVAHALKSAGYRTGLFGKMHFSPIDARHGFDVVRSVEHVTVHAGYDPADKDDYRRWIEAQGLADVRFETRKERRFPYDETLHPAHWITDEALRFVGDEAATEPFFAIVSYTGPHSPHDPPEPYASMYSASEEPLPEDGMAVNAQLPEFFRDAMKPTPDAFFSAQRVDDRAPLHAKGTLAAIRALVRHIDANVGRLLERVDLENTLICFTSDHGDYGGHRGLLGKVPWIPFDDLAKVPLFYAGAGVRGGRRSENLVQSCDLALTFLEAAGALPENPARFDSESLLPELRGEAPRGDRTIHSSVTMGWPMVRRGRYKLIARVFKGTALFDLETDPGETKDIADDHPALVQELTETIRVHHRRPRLDLWGDPAARDEEFLAGAPLRKAHAKAVDGT
jgi:arylsulfatase